MFRTSRLDNETVRQLADRAQQLLAIKNNPAWPVVKEIVEGEIAKKIRILVRTPAVSQQQLDWWRGAIHGMGLTILIIEKGEKEFQRAVEAARELDEEGT